MLLFMVQRRDNYMDEKMIPYIAFESATSRQERTIRRVWILCIILIIALIGTNAGWIYFESQWQVVDSTTVTQDVEATAEGDSDLNLNTVGGDYNGGESEGKTNSN
jgi:hypothetical protein